MSSTECTATYCSSFLIPHKSDKSLSICFPEQGWSHHDMGYITHSVRQACLKMLMSAEQKTMENSWKSSRKQTENRWKTRTTDGKQWNTRTTDTLLPTVWQRWRSDHVISSSLPYALTRSAGVSATVFRISSQDNSQGVTMTLHHITPTLSLP